MIASSACYRSADETAGTWSVPHNSGYTTSLSVPIRVSTLRLLGY